MGAGRRIVRFAYKLGSACVRRVADAALRCRIARVVGCPDRNAPLLLKSAANLRA